jgi:8-oxo-dGTP pyrophosphatase MutT (NUDIX family)
MTMQKIYVQNKPLLLVDAINGEVEEYLHRKDTIFMDERSAPSVRTMLRELEKRDTHAGIFLDKDVQALLTAFKENLQVIVACGGLVYTEQNEVLLIFRKGKWDLPKGKLDEREGLEACALREIEEETGASNLQIGRALTVTYHTYYEKKIHVLKESHWYLIKTAVKSTLLPQTEEDITECKWVPLEEVGEYYHNAHASIVDVLEAGKKSLREQTS